MLFGKFIANEVLRRASRGKLGRQGRFMALMRLPTLLRLAYVLFRDERVPIWLRLMTISLLGLIFSPVDVPSVVPVLGQVWDMTLAVTVLEAFIRWAPAEVVNEHIRALGFERKVPLR